MGAHLARLEMEAIFRHLLVRLEEFEVSGPVERLRSAVNGGIKHLPLRCRLGAG
jgi:cytochrome P450